MRLVESADILFGRLLHFPLAKNKGELSTKRSLCRIWYTVASSAALKARRDEGAGRVSVTSNTGLSGVAGSGSGVSGMAAGAVTGSILSPSIASVNVFLTGGAAAERAWWR